MVGVVAIVVFAVRLLLREDVADIFATLRASDRGVISLAVAIYFSSVFVWALRWRVALASLACRVRLRLLTAIVLSGIFLNNMTPIMRMGGDPFGRVYLLQKLANARYSAAMAASIGEHAYDPLFTVLLLTTGLFIHVRDASSPLGVLILIVGLATAVGVGVGPRIFFKQRIGLSGMGRALSRIGGWVWRRTDKQRIVQGVESFYAGIYTTIDTWQRGIQIGAFTAAIWAMDVLRFYVIFQGLGYRPDTGTLLLASSLPVLVGLIPFLPGGLVIVEGSLVAMFAARGVPLDVAVAVTMVERGISFVLSSIVGGLVFSYLGIRSAGSAGPQEQQ